MPFDESSLKKVKDLESSCQTLARASLRAAQAQLASGAIAQAEFDHVYSAYVSAMQDARRIVYQASHELADQLSAGGDIAKLTDCTTKLAHELEQLKTFDKIVDIALGALTAVVTIASAVSTGGVSALPKALEMTQGLLTTMTGSSKDGDSAGGAPDGDDEKTNKTG